MFHHFSPNNQQWKPQEFTGSQAMTSHSLVGKSCETRIGNQGSSPTIVKLSNDQSKAKFMSYSCSIIDPGRLFTKGAGSQKYRQSAPLLTVMFGICLNGVCILSRLVLNSRRYHCTYTCSQLLHFLYIR